MNNYKKLETRIKSLEQKKKKNLLCFRKEVFPGRDKRFFFIVLPGIRRELPVEGSAGKMSENTRNIQNDGKKHKKSVNR